MTLNPNLIALAALLLTSSFNCCKQRTFN